MPTDQHSALQTRFLSAVRASFDNYNRHGARSSQKLRPLHQWVADEMQLGLGDEYTMRALRTEGGREVKVAGQYYDKTVDVAIFRGANVDDNADDNAPLAVISIKFITSNFKQNANNYFEHLMGETANIRRRGVVFGHFIVIPEVIPYLNRGGEITHRERLGDAHLQKYVTLARDADYPHRPDAIGISIISLPLERLAHVAAIASSNLDEIPINDEIKLALREEFSMLSFFRKMQSLIEAA